MSRNTFTVMEILESYGNYQGKTLQEILELGYRKVFDFEYPFFDEDYKPLLEKKILAHFMDFEICFPTVHRWKFYLQSKLNEILPYYNELYKTTLLDFNPLYTVDMEKTIKQKAKSENETSNTGKEISIGNTKNKSVFNDTPKSAMTDPESVQYATDLTIATGEGTNKNETEGLGKGKNLTESEYIEKIVGKEGGESYQSIIESMRKNILKIDQDIIKDLYSLFILVFDPDDFD